MTCESRLQTPETGVHKCLILSYTDNIPRDYITKILQTTETHRRFVSQAIFPVDLDTNNFSFECER